MRLVFRGTAASVLPIVGLAVLPALPAQAAPVPPVNPAKGMQNVRDDYQGHVDVVRGKAANPAQLRGTVFVDADKDSTKDKNEKGIAGVTVSNGRDVVRTDADGSYVLPVFDRMTVFVTQPAGYAVPVNEDNIAQFSYNHFPNGSPALKFGGIEPTGALPKAVNFPMVASAATAKRNQNCGIASDTQAYNLQQVAYARQGAVRDLVQRDDLGGCGVLLLGDNVGDDLSLNGPTKDIYRQVRGPIRALPGNHDQDYDAPSDAEALDTHKRDFGPAYFSWEAGNAHLVALDNIEYKGAKNGKNGGYTEKLTQEQLDWLAKDLAHVPASKMVVINAHAPFVHYRGIGTVNAVDFFDVLKAAGRSPQNTLLVGGHTHTLENLLPGTQRAEWAAQGLPELPYHQIVSGTVSGDWYSGSLDEDNLPNAYAVDAMRPGTLTIGLRGDRYVESYKIRQEPWTHRFSLGVNSPSWREWAATRLAWRDSKDPSKGAAPATPNLNVVTPADLAGGTFVNANFSMASKDAIVEASLDGQQFKLMKHTQPGNGEALATGWEFSDVPAAQSNLLASGNVNRSGTSMFRFQLPAKMTEGTHTVTVKGTDRHGRVYTQTVRFVVADAR